MKHQGAVQYVWIGREGVESVQGLDVACRGRHNWTRADLDQMFGNPIRIDDGINSRYDCDGFFLYRMGIHAEPFYYFVLASQRRPDLEAGP